MTSDQSTSERRTALRQQLLPGGLPTLWCPLLTPYDDAGRIDAKRLAQHLDFLAPSVHGILVAGSTGDGWQLDDNEWQQLLETVLGLAAPRGITVLIGVLRPDTAQMHAALKTALAWLQQRAGTGNTVDALRHHSALGFTFCPPHGATLTQAQMAAELGTLLDTGVPTALYQLPQVTSNELAPATVREFAARHPNLLMVKDTSGADRVAAAGVDELSLLRGAEGGYSRHLKAAGGRYDGFLLSTANAFGAQFAELIAHQQADRQAAADALSQRLESVVDAVFAAAAPLPFGNPFTNANKALDHWMAYGRQAPAAPRPRLHGGHHLPAELIAAAGDALERHGFMPTHGYLQP